MGESLALVKDKITLRECVFYGHSFAGISMYRTLETTKLITKGIPNRYYLLKAYKYWSR